MAATKRIWLDCDPGHDDATAILLALHAPGLELVGVSTVHGNTDPSNTFINAARCLYAFGARENLLVHAGATSPLLRHSKHDPEIHGPDGLGGVEGLPGASDHAVHTLLERSKGLRAVEGIAQAVRGTSASAAGSLDSNEDWKLTIISTGPMTNIALFVSTYADLLPNVKEFVFMGGGVGVGNRSAVAEYNILCDPEAAQIVLNAPVRKIMVPLNVTHTAIVTQDVHYALLDPSFSLHAFLSYGAIPSQPLPTIPPRARTPLRHTLSTLIRFFAETYKSTFGFTDGPPLHDAVAVAYVARPELFKCTRRRVDVELAGAHTAGETVVDVWNYRKCDESWGREGKNCSVAERLAVNAFLAFFLECVEQCDAVSPLNCS